MSFKEYLGVNYEHSSKEELVELFKALVIAEDLTGAEVDTLCTLWEKGPLEAGDVPSKQGLHDLINKGLVKQWSNQAGDYYGVDSGIGKTTWRALHYLANIQSLPILKSPVVVNIQSELTPYKAASAALKTEHDWVKDVRELTQQICEDSSTELMIDGVIYDLGSLWALEKTARLSYLNILTVKDMLEFVEWLNGNWVKPASFDHVFTSLGIWSIIYPGTANAQYRLTDTGLSFKQAALARNIITDRGTGYNPNARYGVTVHPSGKYNPDHTLLENLLTFTNLK